MRKIIIVTLVIATAFVAAVGAFIVMNINEKPAVTVDQTITRSEPIQSDTMQLAATESFVISDFINGDAIHSGSGSARITNTTDGPILTFGEDFSVTNGPDLFVYMSHNGPGESLGDFASLGRLKSTTGTQSYNAPKDLANYKTVVIWCRAVGVTFATAELTQQ